MNDSSQWRIEKGWQTKSDKQLLFSFWVDGVCHGYPYDKVAGAQYYKDGNTLSLRWGKTIHLIVTGPEVFDFYEAFSEGKGTMLKADGKQILSVTLEETQEEEES